MTESFYCCQTLGFSPVRLSVELLLRRPAHHGHPGLVDFREPVWPFSFLEGGVGRERVTLRSVPDAPDGQDGRDGTQWALARRPDSREAQPDSEAPRLRLALPRGGHRGAGWRNRCLPGCLRIGLSPCRRSGGAVPVPRRTRGARRRGRSPGHARQRHGNRRPCLSRDVEVRHERLIDRPRGAGDGSCRGRDRKGGGVPPGSGRRSRGGDGYPRTSHGSGS